MRSNMRGKKKKKKISIKSIRSKVKSNASTHRLHSHSIYSSTPPSFILYVAKPSHPSHQRSRNIAHGGTPASQPPHRACKMDGAPITQPRPSSNCTTITLIITTNFILNNGRTFGQRIRFAKSPPSFITIIILHLDRNPSLRKPARTITMIIIIITMTITMIIIMITTGNEGRKEHHHSPTGETNPSSKTSTKRNGHGNGNNEPVTTVSTSPSPSPSPSWFALSAGESAEQPAHAAPSL